MPGGDRTGPYGQGPMTGRAAGYCAGYGAPGYANPIPGGGRGGGWGGGRGFGGGGRGWRHQYYATGLPGWARGGWYGPPAGEPVPPLASRKTTARQELEALKAQAEYYGEALEEIRGRIAELEAEAKSEK